MSVYRLDPMATHVLAEAFKHKAATAGDKDRANFADWAEYWDQDGAAQRTHLLDKDDIHTFMEVLDWWCKKTEKYMKEKQAEARSRGRRLIASPSHPWLMSRDVALYLKEGDWLTHFEDNWRRVGEEVLNV